MDYVAAHANPPMVYSTGPVNRPVEYITPVNIHAFVPLTAKTLPTPERLIGIANRWNQSDYSNESWTKCRERIMNTVRSNEDCFRSSPPEIAKDQYSAHSMPVSELPITTTSLPFFNYVAHTFFTLDDVILPRSKPSRQPSVRDTKEFRPKPAVFTTEIPKELFTERFQRTTHVIPTTITTTESAWLPVKNSFMDTEYKSSANLFNLFSSTITTTTTPPLTTIKTTTAPFTTIKTTTAPLATTTTKAKTEAKVFEPPTSWTTAQSIRNNYSAPNVSTESYKHRLKSLKATKTFSSNIETKLKLLKLHLKNLVTTKETPKYIQNVTASAVIESNTTFNFSTTTPTPATSRRNVNRKLRKVRILSSTKKTPIQIIRNSTNANNAKLEHKKPKRMFERRKVFNSTVAPEISKNASRDDIDLTKFKRRATAKIRKPQNVEEIPSVRNSTKILSHTIAKSRADGIPEEKSASALVTESAIMTISSGNIKLRQPIIKVKSKQHSARKSIHIENDNFIPALPIEVYFKKVNQQ